MKYLVFYISIILVICFSPVVHGQQQERRSDLQLQIKDKETGQPLEFALIHLIKEESYRGAVSNQEGKALINNLAVDKYKLDVSLLGYEKWTGEIDLKVSKSLEVLLSSNSNLLNEVVVTASESRGITSSSVIDRKAMQHLQPSSFTDLLELLPGGKSKDPDFSSINRIRIREVGTSDEKYNISSLGVSFVVDGTPISTDANMQQLPSWDNNDQKRISVNKGVDMRSISTDQIERVEIVRGIASVQYGDLTSGLVRIERKKGATPWSARLKVDGYSKLFALDKGFYFDKKKLSLNFGVDFLDSKNDPTNSFAGYQRLTYSIRLAKTWNKESFKLDWQTNFDHAHTFDDIKVDPNKYDNVEPSADLESLKKERYRSKYDRLSYSNNLNLTPKHISFLKSIDLTASVAYEMDKIEKTVFVQKSGILTNPISDEEGISDGIFLPSKFLTYSDVDGKPLNLFLKGIADFEFSTAQLNHKVLVGGEYTFDKNYGKGAIVDRLRPLGETAIRPRKFSDIPSKQNLSFFLEDGMSMPIARNVLKLNAGLRTMSMIGMDSQYKMKGKIYFEPRFNAEWNFPAIEINNKDLNIALGGSFGWQSKFPTLDQIYPDYSYRDFVRLNYYDVENLEQSRVNYQTYKTKTINYDLEPARNKKWEVRLTLQYDNNNLSVTYFRENMRNGFRSQAMDVMPVSYNKYYNEKGKVVIDPTTNQPDLDQSAYRIWRNLLILSAAGNGSQIDKEGLEYTFSSKRIEAFKTRITINGAWFKTKYLNNCSTYVSESMSESEGMNREVVGIFDHSGGDYGEQLNTNLMFDTYIPSLGFEFSTSFQCRWFSISQELPVSLYPQMYIDEYGYEHAYTEESKTDVLLKRLIRESNPGKFRKARIPFEMEINLKASKKIKDLMRVSLFVNKLLDYKPDYTINGAVIRRTSSPYFGMELNITI